METDPFERHNVAATDTQALAGTTAALQAWLVGLSPEPGKLPPADPPFASPLVASPGQAGLRFEFSVRIYRMQIVTSCSGPRICSIGSASRWLL